LTIDYHASHSQDPAYKILGYSSRRFLRHSMNWTIPIALRNLIKYNSAKFAQKLTRGQEKPIVGHSARASMATRFMLALKRASQRMGRKKSK
jgi:hypothetical protein